MNTNKTFTSSAALVKGDKFVHALTIYTVTGTPRVAESMGSPSRPRMVVPTDAGDLRIPVMAPLRLI